MTSIVHQGSSLGSCPTLHLTFGSLTLCRVLSGGRQWQIYTYLAFKDPTLGSFKLIAWLQEAFLLGSTCLAGTSLLLVASKGECWMDQSFLSWFQLVRVSLTQIHLKITSYQFWFDEKSDKSMYRVSNFSKCLRWKYLQLKRPGTE